MPISYSQLESNYILNHFKRFLLILITFNFPYSSLCENKNFYNDNNWSFAFDAVLKNLSEDIPKQPLLNLLEKNDGNYMVFIFFCIYTYSFSYV